MSIRTTIVAGAVTLLLVAPAIAAPSLAQRQPIAADQVGGTVLSVTPQVGFESALLRVSGPAGYALSKRIPAGSPITVDLLVGAAHQSAADNGASAAAAPLLPNGQYHYEVVFTGADGSTRVHSGRFFAEGGALVSTTTKRAELTGIREELAAASGDGPGTEGYTADDYLSVFDQANDDDTHLYMFNITTVFTPWELNNMNDSLRILRTGSSPAMTFLPNGNVGIGTTAPVEELHIVSTTPAIRLEDTSATDNTWDVDGSDDFDIQLDNVSKLTIENDVVAGAASGGFVGIDEANPTAPLHVNGTGNLPTNGDAAHIEGGTLRVSRADTSSNIRFVVSGGAAGIQEWVFLNGQTSGRFEIRDASGGTSPFAIVPGSNAQLLRLQGDAVRVNGRVVVNNNQVHPDYVFDEGYELMDLAALEAYVTQNGHLPGVQSVEEVERQGGFDLSGLSLDLLEKVEELTLHTIQQQKTIQHLQARLAALEEAR